jgi:endonuclease III
MGVHVQANGDRAVTNDKIRLEKTSTDKVMSQGINPKSENGMGSGYALVLGINLLSMKSEEVFKWFLAAVLLGAKIEDGVAMMTYREFEKAGLLSPEAILKAGRQRLTNVLGQGGYAKRRSETVTKLVGMMSALRQKYDGDLNRVHFFAKNKRDLERRLWALGKGLSPATVNIFLRELEGIWDKLRVEDQARPFTRMTNAMGQHKLPPGSSSAMPGA